MKVTHLAQATVKKNKKRVYIFYMFDISMEASWPFWIQSFRLRVTFYFLHDEVALISISNSIPDQYCCYVWIANEILGLFSWKDWWWMQ